MVNKIKEFYDKHAKDYDAHMTKTGHYLAQKKIIIKLINEINEPILDLACGTGYLITILSKRYKIYANDFSQTMINELKNKLPLIKNTKDNTEYLKSHKRKYNTIICCNLFYYLKNHNRAIKKWKQLLNKNGKLILIEEFPFVSTNLNGNLKNSKELLSIIKPKTIVEIIEIMKTHNLHLIKMTKGKIDNYHHLYGLIFKM